jgi:hypothetical protein
MTPRSPIAIGKLALVHAGEPMTLLNPLSRTAGKHEKGGKHELRNY